MPFIRLAALFALAAATTCCSAAPRAPLDVPHPDAVLGWAAGTRPASPEEIDAVVRAIADASPRATVHDHGRTHEGRPLRHVVVTSPRNQDRIDAIRAAAQRVRDPRDLGDREASELLEAQPAIAWMSYVIHGDENSGADAALLVLHELASSDAPEIVRLLERVVVIIDPLMNPDGRARWVRMLAENRTATPSFDDQSLLHEGGWPSGRMNHYLVDLNRDWLFATQPETRARLDAVLHWAPQYFMESHEMGSQDTFLFMPPRAPFHPSFPRHVAAWQTRFAGDLALAFDRRGWRYYTGEWNEGWYPGYSGSWAAMHDIVDNLYEQARISTDGVRRPEGVVETYRDSVEKQRVASLANLATLAEHRREILADQLAARRAAVASDAPWARRAWIVRTGNAGRRARFLAWLEHQQLRWRRPAGPMTLDATDVLGARVELSIDGDAIVVPASQPDSAFVRAAFEFDPRMDEAFLVEERRELLRTGSSRLYDVTAWSVPVLFGLEAFVADLEPDDARLEPGLPGTPPDPASARLPHDATAYAVDGADDRVLAVAVRLMQREIRVRSADRPTILGGLPLARGSILVARSDNPRRDDLDAIVAEAAAAHGMAARAVTTGLGAGDLPDLGGEHFPLLAAPRVAVLGREGVSAYGYGEIWHLVDHDLSLPAAYLDAGSAARQDLRRYNVIVLPDAGGAIVDGLDDALRDWVRDGGTLVAIGRAAAALAAGGGMLDAIRTRESVVDAPAPWQDRLVREWAARSATVSAEDVWSHGPPTTIEWPWNALPDAPDAEEARRRDAWQRVFAPQGALLAARLDDRHWLTAGCTEPLVVLATGEPTLLVKDGAEAPVRFGVFRPRVEPPDDAEHPRLGHYAPPGHEAVLRVGGLLWPEAAARIVHGAAVAREPIGRGQVVLFAESPNFRDATAATARILANAIVCGPGQGADQPIR